MSDTKKSDNGGAEESKLHLKAPRRIVLKKTVDDGSIKQSFSHGRTKSVAVEVRRKKTFVKSGMEPTRASAEGGAAADKSAAGQKPQDSAGSARSEGPAILKPMTPEEQAAYLAEQQRKAREEAERKAQEEAERKAREEAERKAREEAERKAREEAERKAQEEALAAAAAAAEAPAIAPATPESAEPPQEEAPVVEKSEGSKKPGKEKRGAPEREGDEEEKLSRKGAGKRKGPVKPVERELEEELIEESEGGIDQVMAAVEEEKPRKKLTRAQREDVARRKSEDLVAQRLSQVEELREQKREQERQKALQATAEEQARAGRRAGATPESEGDGEERRKTLKSKGRRGDKQQAPAGRGAAAAGKRGRGAGGRGKGRRGEVNAPVAQPAAPVVRDVVIPEVINVSELSNRMAVKASEVVKLLFAQGMMVTINQTIDQDTAVLVVEEMGHRPKPVSEAAAIEADLAESVDLEKDLVVRPPVVTVMGHVDHGKTSLLDAIRQTDVTSREHGGITQHIGAYQVTMRDGDRITFLDTPGHAAFTSMRARGAKVTDLVVLVVAADDGVMPQTVEAINHAKSAKVPIVVAVNKIDKPEANPDKVMQQLTEYELVPEAWGGETIFVPVSAKTGEGLETLEEMILLQAEVLDLKANAGKKARGAIVEAKLDKGRGPVATCLVESGTLRVGDVCVVGAEWGKVRTLFSDRGEQVQEALPAAPVEIVGLSGVPSAGDELVVVDDERRAREIANFRQQKLKEQAQARQAHAKLGDIFQQIQDGEVQELKVVIKGDVQGSVEAVTDALLKIKHEQVRVSVIHQGVGGINESDIMLAMASDAIVVGFSVRADAKARTLADREGVELRFYNVIYNLVDDVRMAMEGMLNPTVQEKVLGHAQVREVFRIAKVGQVAGCMVTNGLVQRNAHVRLLRDNVVIHEGELSSLKRYKDDAKEVREGMECGIGLERYNDIKAGDVLEFYVQEEIKQTIN